MALGLAWSQCSIHVYSVEDKELDMWKYRWMDEWRNNRWLDGHTDKWMGRKKEGREGERWGRGEIYGLKKCYWRDGELNDPKDFWIDGWMMTR